MQAVIKEAVLNAVQELGLPEVDFVVEHPSDIAHGDYAVNVALVLSKVAGKSPRELATDIVAKLEGQIEYVDKLEIAGPGFINFYLARDFFTSELARIQKSPADWGSSNLCQGEEVLLEYTSPNLFKPLHVGNLVGNIIGESLVRLFEFAGANVRRLNYPSDIGLPVAKAVWGLKKTDADADDIAALGEAYRFGNEAYENDETAKNEIVAINQALYAGEEAGLLELRTRGIATSRRQLQALIARLGTHFDTEIFESEAAPVGVEIVKENLGKVFVESEGAVVYEGERSGLHTRVFLNSKGLPTYEAKDLGNFVLKRRAYPNWKTSIVVTGNEQAEYFKVIFAAIEEIFPEAKERDLEHVATGFLTLSTGKMSSRKGNVLTGESLFLEMEEAARERAANSRTKDLDKLTTQVAVAALKYQILRQKVGSNIVFNKEQALSFEGDSGPYLQYTFARAESVILKAKALGVESSLAKAAPQPYYLEKIIYRFPEVTETALGERSPHVLVTYLTELAGAFNNFYAHEQIADTSDELAPYKLALTETVASTLKQGLWLLGIEAPNEM